jgi:hypothetical protein
MPTVADVLGVVIAIIAVQIALLLPGVRVDIEDTLRTH